MPEPDPCSAVVVRVRLPDGLARLRQRHDPDAAARLPAHLTLLYPFLPVAGLAPGVRRALAGTVLDAIAASARRSLPFARHVSTIEVLAQRGDGRWFDRWRLPLAIKR